MNGDILASIILLLVACALMVTYKLLSPTNEGFESQVGDRCGVDMPTCPEGTRCMNGYCMTYNPPKMPMYSEIPVKPSDINDPGSFLHTEQKWPR